MNDFRQSINGEDSAWRLRIIPAGVADESSHLDRLRSAAEVCSVNRFVLFQEVEDL